MKWNLYKFESQLYLGANIQAVSSHVVAFNTVNTTQLRCYPTIQW